MVSNVYVTRARTVAYSAYSDNVIVTLNSRLDNRNVLKMFVFYPQKMPGEIEEHKLKRATFGMGCFWAGDSLFGVTPGVVRTCVGYAGGVKPSPAYRNMYVIINTIITIRIIIIVNEKRERIGNLSST